MKMLCAKCFSPMENVSKSIAVCNSCGSKYILQNKATIFRVLLDGGFIKEGMSSNDIIKAIEIGNILPDEYIATYNGPWIAIIDSPFSKFIKENTAVKTTKKRIGVFLYFKNKRRFIAVTILSSFFLLSLIANVILLWIINNMNDKIEDLITKITAG